MPGERKHPAASFGLVAVGLGLLAWLYWRLGVEATASEDASFLASGDLWLLYEPLLEHGFSALRAFDLPLWNPWQGLGMPFVASGLVGLFYPLNALHLLLPTAEAMTWTAILHLGLAGLFMGLFLHRGLGLGLGAAVFGAVAYQLSGAVTREVLWPSILEAMVWLPMELLFLELLLRHGRSRWSLALAASLGLQILTGGIYLVVHSAYTLAAWSLFRLVGLARAGAGWRSLGVRVGLGLAAGLLAMAVSAVQWLPTLELAGRTVRAFEGLRLVDAEPFREVLSPRFLLTSLVRPASGTPSHAYVGVVPLLLALAAALGAWRRPAGLFFSGWAALTFLLACGSHTPVFRLFFHYLPTGDWFRVPSRILWLSGFSLIVLAAVGLDRFARHGPLSAPWSRGLVVVLVALSATDLLIVNRHFAFPHPDGRPELLSARDDQMRRLAARAGEGRIWIRGRLRQDLSLPAKIGTKAGVRLLNDYEPMSPRAWRDLAVAVAGEEAVDEDPFFVGNLRGDGSGLLRLLELAGVTLVAEPAGRRVWADRPPPGLLTRPADGDLALLEVANPLPPAFLVGEVRVVPDRAERLRALADPALDLSRVALVERPLELGASRGERGAVLLERPTPETVHCRVRTEEASLLVLSELDYPGWRAWVDGRRAEVHRVDQAFRGVLVPAGEHEIVLRYVPSRFFLGAALSVAASLALLFGLAGSRRADRDDGVVQMTGPS